MKKLSILILSLICLQVSAQQSFVEFSKTEALKQAEFEKRNKEVHELFSKTTKPVRKRGPRESAIPISVVTSEQFQKTGDLSLSVAPGIVMGNTGKTNNPTINIRGAKRLKNRYELRTLADYKFEYNAREETSADDVTDEEFFDMLDKAAADGSSWEDYMASLLGGESSKSFRNVMASGVAGYLDAYAEKGELMDTYSPNVKLDYYGYDPAQGFDKTLGPKLAFYFSDEDSEDVEPEDTDLNNYSFSYKARDWNIQVGGQYNYFVGKKEDFGSGSEFKYDGFSIFSAFGGVDYNTCARGGLELTVGFALEFGGSGSQVGFTSRIGGFYDLTPPEKKLAKNIYQGGPSLNYSLTAGLEYYNFGSGSSIGVFGAGLRINFDR